MSYDGALRNIASTRAADGFPRRAFSADDVRRMIDAGVIGEDGKLELIEGDLVVLPPKTAGHELIKALLARSLMGAAPDELLVAIACTLQLSDDVLVNPDIAVVPRALYKEYEGDRRAFARPGVGDVLLIVE